MPLGLNSATVDEVCFFESTDCAHISYLTMLDVENLSDFEFQKLELRFKELEKERKRLDDDRRRFETERATQAFHNKIVQNSIDRYNIYTKADASERRAALKADIKDRVEGGPQPLPVNEGSSTRDVARKLRAQRIAEQQKARFDDAEASVTVESAYDEAEKTETSRKESIDIGELERKKIDEETQEKLEINGMSLGINAIESEDQLTDEEESASDSDDDESSSEGSEADDSQSDNEYYGCGLTGQDYKMDGKETIENTKRSDGWSHYREFLHRAGSCHGESIFRAENQKSLSNTAEDADDGNRAHAGLKESGIILLNDRHWLKKAKSFQDPDSELNLCSSSYIVQEAMQRNKFLTFEQGFEVMQRVSFDNESPQKVQGALEI